MTPLEQTKRNDTKLLLAVAGCVVAGAACIALLAGLSVDGDASQDAARSAPAREPTPAPIEAVVSPPDWETEPVATLASHETVEPAAVEAEADIVPFQFDPGEDLVAGGLAAYRSRDFTRSAAYFLAEAEARPQRAWTHYMAGLSLWKAGRSDEAAASMEESARLDPSARRTLVNLARVRNDQGDFAAALEAARAALALEGQDASALFLEGRSLYNLGRLDEAEASLTASLDVAADNGYVQNMLGLTLIRQGRADEAVAVLERASVLEPQVAYVHNNLGMALELGGRTPEAVAAYRRSAEVDPSHEKAVANLARLGAAVGGETPPVEPVAEQAEEGAAAPVEIADATGNVTP
jgi:tetratricopeptide (TPR) repeat protein